MGLALRENGEIDKQEHDTETGILLRLIHRDLLGPQAFKKYSFSKEWERALNPKPSII